MEVGYSAPSRLCSVRREAGAFHKVTRITSTCQIWYGRLFGFTSKSTEGRHGEGKNKYVQEGRKQSVESGRNEGATDMKEGKVGGGCGCVRPNADRPTEGSGKS